MNFPTLLLLTVTATTLVLRTGERIAVDGTPVTQDGVVVFRAGGALYSLPVLEIDGTATTAANAVDAATTDPGRRPLKVSPDERERLLKALEQNHSGLPPAPEQLLTEPLGQRASADTQAQSQDEWRWRREARTYQEAIRQAKENLALLAERAERLRGEIRGLLSLGYRPNAFTYQTTLLASVEEQIPSAQLQVARTQRAWDQFRDDARRQDILPGWLR